MNRIETGVDDAHKTLETVTSDLAQNAQIIQSLASGAPDGVYDTLADLKTAFPSGDTRVKLVLSDDNWYYWNGTEWSSGGVCQSNQNR